MIRNLSSNVGVLIVRRTITRAIGLVITNAGNILADVRTNEGKANYWLEEWNTYNAKDRFRG